jgi:hypothetical protein
MNPSTRWPSVAGMHFAQVADVQAKHQTNWRKRLLAGVLACSLVAVAAPASAENFLTRLLGNIQSIHMEINSPKQALTLKVRGSMTVNEGETDFATVTDSAFIEERREGQRRSLLIRPVVDAKTDGSFRRVWRVNGQERPFDDEARQWLARVLPAVLRETGLQRDARIQRLVAKGGIEAVLAEIALIESGHARKRYVQSLLSRGALPEKHFNPLLQLIEGIDGDFEKRGALSSMATTQTLSAPQQVALLGVIARMESDFEQRSALGALAPRLTPVPAVSTAWINTLRALESDYERREAVAQLVRKGQGTVMTDLALQSLLQINEDFERSQALGMVLRHWESPTSAQMQQVVEAIRGMRSDYEQRKAIATLLRRADPDRATTQTLLKVVQGMKSSHEQGESLVLLARHMPRDTALVESYRAAVRQLPEHEREEAERALARRL